MLFSTSPKAILGAGHSQGEGEKFPSISLIAFPVPDALPPSFFHGKCFLCQLQGHICILYIEPKSFPSMCLYYAISEDLCTPKLLILSPEPSPKANFIFGEARIV